MMKRNTKTSGFTLIEVMISVGILMAGAASILAMQQASVHANRSAREIGTATDVAQLWLERVRRDSLRWQSNAVGGALTTNYLNRTPNAGTSGWFTPEPPLSQESYAFDWFARDTRVVSEIQYCTHLETRWVVPNEVARVDVRVFWARERGADTDRTTYADCGRGGGEGAVTVDLAQPSPSVRAVHASTVVRWRQP